MADLNESYRILGILPGASFDDAKAAWKLRAQAFHPDRMHDASPEQRAAAERQFKELSEAWHVVRTNLGDTGLPSWPGDSNSRPPSGSNQAWDKVHADPRRTPSKWTITILVAALVVLVSFTGYRLVTNGNDSAEFPEEMQAAIVSQCAENTPLPTCRCFLDNLMDQYSADEYSQAVVDYRAGGPIPDKVAEAIKDCVA